jgi:hypothetical protein
MGLLLTVSRLYLPRLIRKNRLGQLFGATADAFQYQAPELNGLSMNKRLEIFARFTAERAEAVILQGKGSEVKERLYHNAYIIGQNIRKEFNLLNLNEVIRACGVIYKALEIDFRGNLQGQINIPRCFFSSFYSPKVCHIISGLDEGLIAGLSGGLKLEFSQRITEGKDCCRARLLGAGSAI